MRILTALAWNTFLEAVRDRFFYLILGFGVFVFGVSRLLAPLALGEGRRVTLDIGLAGISVFGCLLTIFVGHQLIFREVERKTLYFLFARPIHRAHFVWGKFCGLAAVLTVSVAAMGSCLGLVLFVSGFPIDAAFGQALLFMVFELTVLAAIAVLVASFTTPVLAGLLTFAAYVIGHGSGDLLTLLQTSASPGTGALLRALSWIVPRLDLYADAWPVLAQTGWSAAQMLWGLLYAALYASACLVLATLVLRRRELAL